MLRYTRNATNPPQPLRRILWNACSWCLLLLCLLCDYSCKAPTSTTLHQSIINGTPDLDQPAIGAIVDQGVSFCTGSLITRQLVLTAAHCIASAQQRGIRQIQFRIDFPDPQTNYRSELYNIKTLHTHPLYMGGSNSYEYDLGLLVLTQKVTTTTPLPILQVSMDPSWKGKLMRIVGYGLIQTKPTIKRADQKYAADIPIIQVDPRSFIHHDTITQKSACHGDSGGPALYMLDGNFHIIGITSVAYKASPAPTPGLTYCDGGAVSTRVDAHMTSFLQRYITQYTDAPKACTNDTICAPCGTCQQQICQPIPTTPETTNCRPCHSDQDCGAGVCHRFANGYRCLQPCVGQDKRCCPTGQYCSSSFATTSGSAPLCIPTSHLCPAVPCQQDTECGRGEACKDGMCQPGLPAPTPELCQPCHTSQQCGKNGYCFDSRSSTGYCVQRCTPGRFCPENTTCQQIAPGLDMCIPTIGCFVQCDVNSPCPNDYTCKKNQCIRQSGGIDGDFCHTTLPCHPKYQCLPADKQLPQRCAKKCGAPVGTAGSSCTNGLCQGGLKCLQINSTTRACLESCKETCVGGGQCYTLGSSTSVCLCQDDVDCERDQYCNFGALRDLGVGACTKKQSGPPPCRPGLECEAFSPYGHFCRPAQGERNIGQTCSFLQRCAKGLTCHQLTTIAPTTCLEPCSQQQSCRRGGRCLTTQQGESYCLCSKTSECTPGSFCRIVGASPSVGDIGFCEPSPDKQCNDDNDCPPEHSCDTTMGSCGFNPSKQNEPFPKSHPEPKIEPTPEVTPEPIAPDASTNDTNTNEPSRPQDDNVDKREPASDTPNHDKDVTPRGDKSTPREPTIVDEVAPTRPTCGCQQTHNPPKPMILILILAVLLSACQRRKQDTPK